MSEHVQSFGSVFLAETRRVVLKPKRLIIAGIFAVVSILVFMGATAVLDWGAATAANTEGMEEAASVIPTFLGYDLPLSFLSFCFGIYAASFAARDYNDGVILSTLLRVPNRLRLFLARLLPWVAFSFVFSLVAFMVIAVLSIGRVDSGQIVFVCLEGLLAAVGVMFTTILGFCCGSLTKKGSLSVILFLGLFFIIPAVLSMVGGFGPEIVQKIVEYVDKVMPGSAFGALPQLAPVTGTIETNTLIELAISFVWVIGVSTLSYILFKKRGTLK